MIVSRSIRRMGGGRRRRTSGTTGCALAQPRDSLGGARFPPFLRMAAVALVLTFTIGGACGKTDTRPNILLIIIDTLRADFLGCYGARTGATPNMDGLAAGGACFTQCVTSVPVTLPSVSTILTSSYPIFHGVRDNGTFKLDESMITLAEVFREAGYSTAAVVGAYVLTDGTGVEQGFEHFDSDFSGAYKLTSSLHSGRAEEVAETQRRADEVSERAAGWLKGEHNPFFLVAHYFDPHGPYDPPPPFAKRFEKSKYLGEVAYTDSQLGPLVQAAEAAAGETDLITVLVADHGEGLGQHGEKQHGFFIYDSTVLVPFLVQYPGHIPPSVAVDDQVSTVDVAPTIADLAGVPIPESWQGVSFAERIVMRPLDEIPTESSDRSAADVPPLRTCYMETYRTRYSYDWSELVGIRYDGWKLIRAPMPELYDVEADPEEKSNLYALQSDRAQQMDELLEEALHRWGGPLGERGPTVELDQSAIDKLEALGYVMPHQPKSTGPLPDPKEMMASLNRRLDSKELVRNARPFMEKGDLAEAERILSKALELDPSNAVALNDLGTIHWKLGQHEKALELLGEAARLNPGSASPRQNMAIVYLDMNKIPEAIVELEAAMALDPRDARVRMHYGRALEEQGKIQPALEQYYECLRLDPDQVPAYFRTAVILARLGRTEEASAQLEQVLARRQTGELAEPARMLLKQIGEAR